MIKKCFKPVQATCLVKKRKLTILYLYISLFGKGVCVETRGQPVGVDSLLLSCGSHGSKSGHLHPLSQIETLKNIH